MQHHGALAYQQTTKTVEQPREREAALLMKAAGSLQRIRDTWPNTFDELEPALMLNRKMWTIFMTSATREDSQLPIMVRQNIVNLGLFIMNETRETLLAPSPQRLDTLININRQLAVGLRAS